MSSRWKAHEILLKQWKPSKKFFFFLLSFLFSFGVTYLVKEDSFSDSATYTLFILLFSICLWITEAIPPFAVGMLIIGFQVYFLGSSYLNSAPETVGKYLNTWSSPIIWLMLGGFFIAEALRKTALDKQIFKIATSIFGSKPQYVLLGLMLTTAISSMIMSNTATTAMMIAAVMPYLNTLKEEDTLNKAILLGIPTAASIGGMGTIIGTPPNAITIGSLAQNNIQIDFLQWMFYGFPVSLGLLLLFWFILSKKFIKNTNNLNLDISEETTKNRFERNFVLITLFITLSMWMTSPLHKIPTAAIAGLPIIMLTLVGIITHESIKKLPWDTLILVAGGLSLGLAISDSGLADFFIQKIDMKGQQPILVYFVFSFLTIILSNIMSNTATTTILLPIAVLILPEHFKELALIIGLSASNALLLPVSTPPNAIAFSTGKIQQSDFQLGGIIIGLISPFAIIGWVLLLS